jgi:hypothetical protein
MHDDAPVTSATRTSRRSNTVNADQIEMLGKGRPMVDRTVAPFVVSAEADIAAPPERIYRIIADYRNGHPQMLPPQFSRLTVLQGGIGAGTRISFTLRVLGQPQHFEADIVEPEPGRVLAEHQQGARPSVTSFIVDRAGTDRPAGSHVTIRTELALATGWLGAAQRFVTRRFLQSIYRAQLARLAVLATDPVSQERAAHV